MLYSEKMQINKFLLIIIFLAFIIRLWGINYDLPEINRYLFETDEQQILTIAMGFGMGDFNPHSFQHPGMYYYLLFFLFAIFYLVGKLAGFSSSPADFANLFFNHRTGFYLIGRGTNVIFGVLSVYLIYKIGRKMFGPKTGLLSALFLAVMPLHVLLSHTIKPDILATLFFLLSLYYALDIAAKGTIAAYIKASMFAGLAFGTRYPIGVILITVFVAHFTYKAKKALSLDGLKMTVLIFGVFLTSFFVVSPYNFIAWREFIQQTRQVAIVCSTQGYKYDWAVRHIINFMRENEFGVILTLLSISGIFLALMKRSRYDLILSSAWVFTYIFFCFPKWLIVPPQYLLPLFPVWILLGARFLAEALDKLNLSKTGRFLLVVLFFWPPFLASLKGDIAFSAETSAQRAKEWVEVNLPEKSRIFTSLTQAPQLTLTFQAHLRWRAYVEQCPQRQWFGGVRQDFVPQKMGGRNSTLIALREKSLMEGKPYDVYFNEHFNEIKNLDEFKSFLDENRIEYITASLGFDKYLSSLNVIWLELIQKFYAHPWMPAYPYDIGIYKVKR